MIQINNTIITKKSKTNFNEKISISSLTLSLLIILIMILILVAPVTYSKSVINGLKLYFTAVLPGLLPFMFLCKLLTCIGVIDKLAKPLNKPMRKLFGLNGSCFYAFIMSIISGYPIGSKITADLYNQGKISDKELTRCALLSSTSGPIFVIGSVGGIMLSSLKAGIIIYVSNLIGVLLTSIIINLFSKKQQNTISNLQKHEFTKQQFSLYLLAKDTVINLLIVGFYISLFSLFIDLLTNLNIINILSNLLGKILSITPINPSFSTGIMSGIFEMTNGCKTLSSTISAQNISLICFVISFSGLSIIIQSLSFLSATHIKPHKFILGKFLQAIISFIICLIISSLFL